MRVRVSFSSPETICGNSSVGRAQPCQGWGREFESRFPLKSSEAIIIWWLLLCFQYIPRTRDPATVRSKIDKVYAILTATAGSSLVFRSKVQKQSSIGGSFFISYKFTRTRDPDTPFYFNNLKRANFIKRVFSPTFTNLILALQLSPEPSTEST